MRQIKLIERKKKKVTLATKRNYINDTSCWEICYFTIENLGLLS